MTTKRMAMRFSRLAVLLTLPVFGAYGADTQQAEANPSSDPQKEPSAQSQTAASSGQYAPTGASAKAPVAPPYAGTQRGGGGPGPGMMGGPGPGMMGAPGPGMMGAPGPGMRGGPPWGPPGMMVAPGAMQEEGPASQLPPELQGQEGDYPPVGPGGGYPGMGQGPGPMPGYGPPQGPPGAMMGGGMMRGPGASSRMGRGMRGMAYVMQALHMPNLSDEQRDQIRKVAQNLRKKHWEIQGSMMDQRDKLSELWSAEPVDAVAVGDAYGQVCDLKRQMLQASIEAKNQVDEVLSAGQAAPQGPQGQGQPSSPGADAPSGKEQGSGGGSGSPGDMGT
jgi:Spy/CpxP family protein refolding chaperone